MKNVETKGRTLEIIKAEANAKVDEMNKTKELSARLTLDVEIDKLVKEYDKLALLTVYASAKAEDLPIIALAKVCTYSTIRKVKTPGEEVVDGVVKPVDVYSLSDKVTVLNILKFIKWLEERNYKMPTGWQSRMSAVKANIIDQWQAFDKAQDEHIFRIGQLKRLVQDMVDDMGMMKTEQGNNALRATSAHARTLLKYANRKTGVQTGDTLTPKIWDELLMTVLNSIASGAAFENTYGGTAVFEKETATAEDAPATAETTEAPATAEAEAPAETAPAVTEAVATEEVKAE